MKNLDYDLAVKFAAAVTSIKLSYVGPFRDDLATVIRYMRDVYGVEIEELK